MAVLRRILVGQSSEKLGGKRVRSQDEAEILLHIQLILPPLKNEQVNTLEEEPVFRKMSLSELEAESVLRGI